MGLRQWFRSWMDKKPVHHVVTLADAASSMIERKAASFLADPKVLALLLEARSKGQRAKRL